MRIVARKTTALLRLFRSSRFGSCPTRRHPRVRAPPPAAAAAAGGGGGGDDPRGKMPGKTIPCNPKLTEVANVDIGETGEFKYVLCKVYEGNNTSEFKYIVRGSTVAEFHSDVFDTVDAEMEVYGLNCECVGGGKMAHDPDNKTIQVFGKSQGYGPANHSITVDILKKWYTDYTSISWSDF